VVLFILAAVSFADGEPLSCTPDCMLGGVRLSVCVGAGSWRHLRA